MPKVMILEPLSGFSSVENDAPNGPSGAKRINKRKTILILGGSRNQHFLESIQTDFWTDFGGHLIDLESILIDCWSIYCNLLSSCWWICCFVRTPVWERCLQMSFLNLQTKNKVLTNRKQWPDLPRSPKICQEQTRSTKGSPGISLQARHAEKPKTPSPKMRSVDVTPHAVFNKVSFCIFQHYGTFFLLGIHARVASNKLDGGSKE